MVNHEAGVTCCDGEGCGRSMAKAKKIHEGLRYCDTCYPRLFKKRLCPGCGNHARLPVFDTEARCTKCLNSRPCIRCHRVGQPVGKLTLQGPVCNSCAPYVDASGHCEICHQFRTRLANKTVDGQVRRCCTGCANTASATCPRCRRYRVLVESADGTLLCKLCADFGEVACKVCEQSMPAGLGSECQDCYWKRTFHKRLDMNTEGFSSHVYRQEFRNYGVWLNEQVRAKEAALLINKHMLFFVEMAERWPSVPTYEQLLHAFGADWLRRAKYPVRWMIERHGMAVDEPLKKQSVESHRIDTILASVRPGLSQTILSNYHELLVARTAEKGTSLVSIRTSLRSAANLLAQSSGPNALPSTKALRELLVKTPGLAASVTGFVTYLNTTYSLSITFPKHGEVQKLRQLKMEQTILALAKEARSGTDVMSRWIPTALSFFHGVSRLKQSGLTVQADGHGLRVNVGESEYWIPSPVAGLSPQ